MPYGPNYRMAESSSLVKSGSGVAGICDMTYDCDILVIYDSDSLP